MDTVLTVTAILFEILMVPFASPLIIGITRKVKARMQSRHGASVFQPYWDLLKLFKKDEVISKDTSWIFRFAPYMVFSTTITAAAGIPIITAETALLPLGDFLVFVYLMAFGTFFLALSGMDAGSAFGGFGSSREMTMAALKEGGLIFSLLTAAIMAQASNFGEILAALSAFSFVEFVPLVIAFAAFFIALLCENSRYPFDNPSTHLELTMIHEAMILEYSGKRLALMEWAAANKLLIFIILGVQIFFPWGIASNFSAGLLAVLVSLVILCVKVLTVVFTIAILESTISKLRFFRLPDLLLTSLAMGVIALVVVIV